MYALFNMLSDLSALSGNDIGVKKDKNGNFVLTNNGGIKGAKGSKDAAGYIDNLISSEGTIYVGNSSRDSDGGMGEKGRNEVNLGTDQIDDHIASLEDAGMNGRSFGFGMTFLHESLHTWVGTYALDGASSMRDDTYSDAAKPGEVGHDPNGLGEVETILNKFRSEVGWESRDRYFSKKTVNTSGQLVKETMKFGGKEIDKIKMNPYQKIYRRLKTLVPAPSYNLK